MLIRLIAGICVAITGLLVFVTPYLYAPERFSEQLRAEQTLNTSLWGSERATRIALRMQALDPGVTDAAPVAAARPDMTPASAALARNLSQMSQRVIESPYFRCLDALLSLAAYRLAAWLEWLPLAGVFCGAAWCDGLVRRVVKSKTFAQHSAEVVCLHVALIVLLLGCTLIAFAAPWVVHPLLFAAAPIAAGVCGNAAIANYHRHA